MFKPSLSLFVFAIAAVLVGGFAWLEYHQPTEPTEQDAYELLEALRKNGSGGTVEVAISKNDGSTETLIIDNSRPPKTDASQANSTAQDDEEERKFQALLEKVRRGGRTGFSKRFEVDTINALKARGYNPDGTLMDPGKEPGIEPMTDSPAK